jgi:adenylate kinase family enzyme
MEKIVIIGSSGAGKSTFAQKLGAILAIEVVHLDRYFWQPGWKEYPRPKRLAIQQELLKGKSRWIIEGTYLGSSDGRLKAADTIIFLDIPWFICLWRVIQRHMVHRKFARPDLPVGSTDRVTPLSLLKVVAFPLRDRRLLLKKIEDIRAQEAGQPVKKTIHMFRSDERAEDFLLQLCAQQGVRPSLPPTLAVEAQRPEEIDADCSGPVKGNEAEYIPAFSLSLVLGDPLALSAFWCRS